MESFIEGLADREAEVDESSDTIAKAVARIRNRSPEQMLADRERILGLTPPPRPIADGKTLFDVVERTWPGDETEAQIREILERLS